jgi:template-activating factor I
MSEGPKKKAKVESTSSPGDDEAVLAELHAVQDELEKLNKEENDKILEVVKQYSAMKKPILKKRSGVITKIPDFWFTVLERHPIISSLIQDEDKEILKFIKDIDVDETPGPSEMTNWKITMTFNKNPYFTNKTLWKEFKWTEGEEPELKVTASKIAWQKGKNPMKQEKKGGAASQKGKGKRELEEEETISFFHWFDADDEDEQLGEIFREEIYPHAVAIYQGHFVQGDDDEGDSGDDEGEGGEGEGEGEEQANTDTGTGKEQTEGEE